MALSNIIIARFYETYINAQTTPRTNAVLIDAAHDDGQRYWKAVVGTNQALIAADCPENEHSTDTLAPRVSYS